jgi:hypothetical protein
VLLLGGLTGPFVVLLLPIAGTRWMVDRDREWSLWIFVVVAVTFVIQVPVLLESNRSATLTGAERSTVPG